MNLKTRTRRLPATGKPKKERKPLTEAQRLKRQKMIVLPAMVLVFIGAMWLIFAPSSGKEQQPGNGRYNIEMPDADKANRQIIGDKAKAYEQGAMEERQENRSRAMQQLGDMFDREVAETDGGRDFDLANPGKRKRTANHPLRRPSNPPQPPTATSMPRSATSTSSRRTTMRRWTNCWSASPRWNRNWKARKRQGVRYGRPGGTHGEVLRAGGEVHGRSERHDSHLSDRRQSLTPVQKAGKNTAAPVRQVTHQVVSSLSQPDEQRRVCRLLLAGAQPQFQHGGGRHDRIGQEHHTGVCLWGAERDGRAGGQVRLLEPMAVADRIIPRNAVVVGTAKIQGERLDIEITSLEYDGTIIPVELAVYDTDGQPGIFIPNSMEMNAVREVAANMGGSLGSSINISTNAGAQLASDLGKGLIQGTSQYIAKKMRTVKVHLKAGYKGHALSGQD